MFVFKSGLSLKRKNSSSHDMYNVQSVIRKGWSVEYQSHYYHNTFSCTDINECAQEDFCGDSKTVCENTFGSYTCKCKDAGYRWTSKGCEDIDECKNGAHKCDLATSKCQKKNGGYDCVCLKGYKKNKEKCVGKCLQRFLFRELSWGGR